MRYTVKRLNKGALTSRRNPDMSTKPAHVREMFGSIATRYDLANHVLSCGIDFYWRARAAEIIDSWHPRTIADLATGTGDLALAIQRKLTYAELTGVDFVPEMLELAQRKGVRRVVLADAMKLPFGDASFDCVTIGFACGTWKIIQWRSAKCGGSSRPVATYSC